MEQQTGLPNLLIKRGSVKSVCKPVAGRWKGKFALALAEKLTGISDDPRLSPDERALIRCRFASELEEAEQYEAACDALGEMWCGAGQSPMVDGLQDAIVAEVLLRTGALNGWVAEAGHGASTQKAARDLITASLTLFHSLGQKTKVAAARAELALCCWREGAFDEARLILEDVLSQLDEEEGELRAITLLRLVLIACSTGRYSDALHLLTDAAPLFESGANNILKGKFHSQLALTLKHIGQSQSRRDYLDRALLEYTAASYHFEKAGQLCYRARDEFNLGNLLLLIGNQEEAQVHLERARDLSVQLEDVALAAQIDESRARLYLAEGRLTEAEKTINAAVEAFEEGEKGALLAESLTTQAVVLARLGERARSRAAVQRAMDVARGAGCPPEYAGRAALTLIEEHCAWLTDEVRREAYLQADECLKATRDASDIERLRECARSVLRAAGEAPEDAREEREAALVFVHEDVRVAALLERAQRFAGTLWPLLISGEKGTGKELLAHLIHHWSGRSGPFVPVNCAGMEESLVDSLLFGRRASGDEKHALAASSGAVREARGGTLFLKEIEALTPHLQHKVLRLLEHGELRPVGARKAERAEVRVIVSTRRDLAQMVCVGGLLPGLHHSLESFTFQIPPLRERSADIVALANHFTEQAAARVGKQASLTENSLAWLQSLPLLRNAHDLRPIIERAVQASSTAQVELEELVLALRLSGKGAVADAWADFSLAEEVQLFEEQLIERALKVASGSVTRAAKLLGMKHQTLNLTIKHRHKRLLGARKPVRPRRRSSKSTGKSA